VERVTTPELSSRGGRARGYGTGGSVGAHLSREVRSEAAGHVTAPERSSARRCTPKLQFTWQYVDTHTATYLNLELVCGVPGLQCADTEDQLLIKHYKK
jgi:hypothetical protein